MAQFKNLIGEKYGKLEVLDLDKDKKPVHWICRCECGQQKSIRTNHLTSGSTLSCGCHKRSFENLKGRVFTRLTVVDYREKIGKEHYWDCKCSCGSFIRVGGNWLRSGNTKSCGCLLAEITAKRCTKHGLAIGKHKGQYNPQYEKYLRTKPEYRLRKTVSKLVWDGLKNNKASKGGKSVWNFLPYSLEKLKEHLESNFESWMSWQNYGTEWHVDHILPRSSFNYTSMEDQSFLDCWALSNLRPLRKIDNLSKGNRIISKITLPQ